MKRGRPANPLNTIRNWIEDARKEIRCANRAFMTRPPFNPRTKFRGIGAAAKALGCNRNHLWLVLTGRRTSHSLLRRYHQLKEAA